MKTLKAILIIVIAFVGFETIAQQEAHFTQYMDNTLFVNPGYAGSNGALNATAIHREQWVGIEGRPRSTTFSLHSPLKYESIGVGMTVVNDVVGPIQQTQFYGDFSYTLKFDNSPGKLSFGLKAGVNMLNSRTDQLGTTDPNDPEFITNIQNQINPNFGAGVYYHAPAWFVGVSTPRILEAAYEGTGNARERRHYYVIGGAVFDIARQWKLRPTTSIKVTDGAPLSVDLSAAGIYNEKLWLGLTHRFGDSFGAFVQYQITPQFKAGIAYDQTITDLISYNVGTYEVLLSYDFYWKDKGVKSPRYF
ncbi:MAG: type IX secretion system membrane protein PorP/SprF [Crocinitomicaceae bacterium]